MKATDRIKRRLPDRLKQWVKGRAGVRSVETSLCALKARGYSPRTVIDVGAYRGEWAVLCQKIYPASRILMIEPLEERKHELQGLRKNNPNLAYRQALLGSAPRDEVAFYTSETASSVLPESAKQDQQYLTCSMTTLDVVTADTEFACPDFIKLDVQGYELEVLAGAEDLLLCTEVILMEVNLLPIYKGAPSYAETIAYMDKHGFQLYDICAFMERPLDGALWQMDALFVHRASPLLASTRWA
jgi:FkbM family methyltransferase